jgi:SAM-dependent methyltransferase
MLSWTIRAKELLAKLTHREDAPVAIETKIGNVALRKMLDHVEGCWTRLGEHEPHWSVLTQPEFRAARIADTRLQFYESGKFDADRLVEAASRCGIALPTSGTCFELGCGVGRVSIWLAALFDRLIAADISMPHLREADNEFRVRNLSNASPLAITSMSALATLPPFDCFYSVIVLQHNPPPVIRWMLKTILSQLRGGGIGFFQVPVHLPHYRFAASSYLSTLNTHNEMEVHALPKSVILQVLNETNCTLLEEQEHDCLGISGSLSTNFLVLKK